MDLQNRCVAGSSPVGRPFLLQGRNMYEERFSQYGVFTPCPSVQLHVSLQVMLYTIVVVLVILWLLGFIGHIGGGLIHLLLVIAVIVLIFNFISGRR
jgi:hypothetical protein